MSIETSGRYARWLFVVAGDLRAAQTIGELFVTSLDPSALTLVHRVVRMV